MNHDALNVGEKMTTATHEFKCGCKIDKLDFDKINQDCPATWDLINSGFTRGIFQLEGSLGKKYSKELKPRNIDELSDVISLIRPGCLEAKFREKEDKPGKYWSITDTYAEVKNGRLEPTYPHPVLEPIFAPTCSVPVYQEQIMRICTDFAGFSLEDADKMRKAVGKKKKELMESLKAQFVEGALVKGHDKEGAEQVFGWISDFSGYGFNKSHGVSYAYIGYQTAYAKRHFPLEYFKAKLTHSEDKQDTKDEVKALVHEARLFDIEVKPPCLKLLNLNFAIQDKNTIAFGLVHIKGIGKTSVASLRRIAKFAKPDELLIKSFTKGSKVKKNVMEALIKSGALDYLGVNRVDLLVRYKILSGLTERELRILTENFFALADNKVVAAIKLMIKSDEKGKKMTKPRIAKVSELVAEVSRDLEGNKVRACIGYEKHYLGIPITGNELQLYNSPRAGLRCRDMHRLRDGTEGAIAVVIEKVKVIKDKNKNQMCFMTVSDDTYMMECVVFSSTYKNYSWIIGEGKAVLLLGKKDGDSFIVRKIEHL
jgi:DNA polymerase-3 subunit alpha